MWESCERAVLEILQSGRELVPRPVPRISWRPLHTEGAPSREELDLAEAKVSCPA